MNTWVPQLSYGEQCYSKHWCVSVSVYVDWSLLSKCPGAVYNQVIQWGYFVFFWENPTLISIVTWLVPIPPEVPMGSLSFTSKPLFNAVVLITAILSGVRWDLNGVFNLHFSDGQLNNFSCLLTICISSSGNCLFKSPFTVWFLWYFLFLCIF